MNKPITLGSICIFVGGIIVGIGIEKFINEKGIKISVISKEDAQDLIDADNDVDEEY